MHSFFKPVTAVKFHDYEMEFPDERIPLHYVLRCTECGDIQHSMVTAVVKQGKECNG